MGLTIEALFSGEELKALTDNDPYAVIFTVEADPEGKLIITAQGVDDQSNIVGAPANGCPTPCHPTHGDTTCLNQSVELWENSFSKSFV